MIKETAFIYKIKKCLPETDYYMTWAINYVKYFLMVLPITSLTNIPQAFFSTDF